MTASSFFRALTVGFCTVDGETIQMGVGRLTRIGAYVHEDGCYAVVSIDKNAPPISCDTVPDLPEGVHVVELFGGISFGQARQFVIGMNASDDETIRNFFKHVVEIAYFKGDEYMPGSFALLGIVNEGLTPRYLACRQGEILDVSDVLGGIEIVTMTSERVTSIAVKVNTPENGMRMVYMDVAGLNVYIEGGAIDWSRVVYTAIPSWSTLVQAPNQKVGVIDHAENRLTIYDDTASQLAEAKLSEGTVFAKIALTNIGKPQESFMTIVTRMGETVAVETVSVVDTLGDKSSYSWHGSPSPGPEVGATPG